VRSIDRFTKRNSHFGDVVQSQSVADVLKKLLKKLNLTQQDQTTEEENGKNTQTRHRASTSMSSLTFCILFLLPERHQRKPAVQAAAVMLRTPPSTANHRRASHAHLPYMARNFENAPVTCQSAASSTRRPHPAGRSHYVVISRDGRKLVTRVRVMLPYQPNTCPIANPPNTAQLGGSLYHVPKLHPGLCSCVGVRPRTDRQTHRHTDARDHNTFCVVYASRKM